MKRAIVVGSRGQDGRLLVERLSRDRAIIGVDVDAVTRHSYEGELPSRVDVQNEAEAERLIARVVPDEVYYLAAHHHSSEERPDDAAELRACTGVNLLGVANVLGALTRHARACRLFYAGSSHMFGSPTSATQNESTPFSPRNPYAITKVAGAHACALFRERGIHASVGILYNHESPLRGPQFVTQRIARAARQAEKDRAHKITIGSLASNVDWGWAPDYVDAMVRIVEQPAPDDYVVATGEPHTVQELATIAFAHVGLDWREHVVEDRSRVKGLNATLVGDATKLRERTGWRPSVSFTEIVKRLVDAAKDGGPPWD